MFTDTGHGSTYKTLPSIPHTHFFKNGVQIYKNCLYSLIKKKVNAILMEGMSSHELYPSKHVINQFPLIDPIIESN